MKGIMKRYLSSAIAWLIIFLVVIGWSAMWYVIGHHNAVIETTERVTYELTAEFEAQMQAYIDEINYKPEDYDKTSLINELTDAMDELVAGYTMNSNINYEGRYAICWCFIARYETKGFFGSTPQEILEKPNQWQWYSADNATRPEDIAIARAVATAYVNKQYPRRFTTDLCYAELYGDGSVELRNKLYTNEGNVKYWNYEAD